MWKWYDIQFFGDRFASFASSRHFANQSVFARGGRAPLVLLGNTLALPLKHDAAFKLGDRAKRVQHKLSHRRAGVMFMFKMRSAALSAWAHELGHAVMHNGVEMPRRALGNITAKWLKSKPFESAEHQVRVFAPAFLINDLIAETLRSADDISIEFGISSESAKIYFEELTALRDHDLAAEKIRRIAEQFRESVKPVTSKLHFINDACTVCGSQTVFPVGSKFMCQSCNNVSNRFQDGDRGDT
jgi:hypothetical protein